MGGELPTERWADYLRDNFPNLWYVPIAFVTGESGKNIKKLLNHAQMLFKQSRYRVGTGELNRLIRNAVLHHAPPIHKKRRPKIFYVTQVTTQPPTIVIMCNDPSGFPLSYRKFILGVLRDQLSFGEVPIKVYWQKRRQSDERDEIKMGAKIQK